AGDNGTFHVGVSAEKLRNPQQLAHVVVSLAGVRKRLLILLKPATLDFASQRILEMPHSQFVRTASQAVTTLKADLQLEPAPADDASSLLEALEALPDIRIAIDRVRAEILGIDAPAVGAELDEEEASAGPLASPRTMAL